MEKSKRMISIQNNNVKCVSIYPRNTPTHENNTQLNCIYTLYIHILLLSTSKSVNGIQSVINDATTVAGHDAKNQVPGFKRAPSESPPNMPNTSKASYSVLRIMRY